MLHKNTVLSRLWSEHGRQIAEEEGLESESIQAGLENGSMVLLANPEHENVQPVLIGQPAAVKVNANIGTSPFMNDPDLEVNKAVTAYQAGAHTVMDLSTGGDLDVIRRRILQATPMPLGTVPLYSVAQKYIANGEDPGRIPAEDMFAEIEHQAGQGVDFMTLHCGVSAQAAAMAREGDRSLGIVSRGGSILARWMEVNDRENPLLEDYDRLLDICLAHNVTISLGDGLRPGAGADAGDRAQWEEVVILAGLVKKARQAGVQAMVEGPGHVPLHLVQSQIQAMKRLCGQAPLYVLGPLPTDIAPGYDHIAGAIGGALAATAGVDFLCYLTPAEHLTLPNEHDVWQGVKASLVAAHCAEVSLGRRQAVERNTAISRARKDLDWEKITEFSLDPDMVRRRRETFAAKEECAMCGDFCAVKLLR
ncbi:phosphomethylpyrimidine synthase ThiC [Desulfovermiculus halophilus]|jgi:phosphomethylpyrimidine synthase|uniref:phosphomethylpyrimidine synthase ThiC n=1 Tax=Desulfovermiculus halophilus TaxID=339722 RepID=UPI00048956D1|nr:phosphomethylpyrimidine synthase ThiC [Desulfovermiculus halophilus]